MTSFFLSSSPFPNIKAHIIGLNSTPIIGTLSIDNSLIYTKKPHISVRLPGAENETRTRDPDLGKVVLYQLSYFRLF